MAANSRDLQLIELKDMISQLNTTIKTLNETIAKQQAENDNLKAELAWFRRKLFGSSSEHKKTDVEGQLNLFDDSAEDEKPVELIEPEIVPQEKPPPQEETCPERTVQGHPNQTGHCGHALRRRQGLPVMRRWDGADRYRSDSQRDRIYTAQAGTDRVRGDHLRVS